MIGFASMMDYVTWMVGQVSPPPSTDVDVQAVHANYLRRPVNRCAHCGVDLDFYGCFCADSDGGECD